MLTGTSNGCTLVVGKEEGMHVHHGILLFGVLTLVLAALLSMGAEAKR